MKRKSLVLFGRKLTPALVTYFANRFRKSIGRHQQKIPSAVIDELCNYDWSGNIRELQNVIERAMILSKGNTLSLPPGALPIVSQTSGNNGFATLAMNEKARILAALRACGGVVGGPNGAAQLLDVHKNTLRSRMEKLEIRASEK